MGDAKTLDDLRWIGPREERHERTGKFITTRAGNRKEIMVPRTWVRTRTGEMRLDDWFRQMELYIEASGHQELFQRVFEHCQGLAWLKTEKQVREYALECMGSEAYKDWEGFK